MNNHLKNLSFSIIMYWWESSWNARLCVPVVMTVNYGYLTVATHQGRIILSEPLGSVSSALKSSGMEKLHLSNATGTFTFSTKGTPVSPAPGAKQKEVYSQVANLDAIQMIKMLVPAANGKKTDAGVLNSYIAAVFPT